MVGGGKVSGGGWNDGAVMRSSSGRGAGAPAGGRRRHPQAITGFTERDLSDCEAALPPQHGAHGDVHFHDAF
ncbi:hypothetical protein GCM10022416_62740 [Actinomadura keratinilytica]|uniref:Uncharacterized protein n=1 Tax=Actinomadura keratinilytica TaxID=547461 RepID=A0ABP6UHW0_9ACTN